MRIAATNVTLSLGDGTRTLLSLTGGSAAFVLPSTGGVAGRLTGTVALTGVPGVSLTATFDALVNTTTGAVHESFLVGDAVLTVDALAGTPFQVTATGVSLTVAGQTLTGDITVTKASGSLTVTVAHGSLSFGPVSAPLVRAQDVAGSFTLVSGGLYGSGAATVGIDAPGIQVGGTIALSINTTGSAQGALAPGVTATITNPTLVIAGQSIGADSLTIRRSGDEVALSVTNARITFGTVVTITAANHASGALVVTAGGVAGSFTLQNLTGAFALPGSMTVAGSVAIVVNTGSAAVSRPELGLDVPAGPFLRVAVTNGDLSVSGGPSFHGSFVLVQDATPGFAAAAVVGSTGVTAVAIGDVNGDGRPDLVVGTAGDSSVYLGGTTAGTFGSPTLLTGGTGSTVGIGLADLNGDNRLDVVVVRATTSAVFLGLSAGGFAAATTVSTTGATAFALGDVTGDGLSDLVVGGTTVRVLANQGGTTTWSGLAVVARPELTDAAVTGVALADLDHNGRLDLVIVNTGAAHHVYLNRGVSGTWLGFALSDTLANTLAARAVAVADLDGDGWAEVVVAVNGAAAQVYLNRALRSGSTTTGGAATAADSSLTVASTAGFATAGVLLVETELIGYTGLTATSFTGLVRGMRGTTAAAHATGVAVGASPWQGLAAARAVGSSVAAGSLAVGDVDGDGQPDILLGTPSGVVLLLNLGAGPTGSWSGFGSGALVTGATGSVALALANVYGGATVDVIAADATAGLDVFRAQPVRRTLIGFSDVSVSLTPSGGSAAVGITQGQGAFLVTATGVAGSFSGVISVAGGALTAGAQVAVRYNATGGAVDERVEVDGVSLPIVFTTAEAVSGGTWVSVAVSGALRIGDFVEISGTISFTGSTVTVSNLTIFLGQGPGFLADGTTLNPLARGLYLTGVNGQVTGSSGSRAFTLSGSVLLVGFAGVSLAGSASVYYNEGSSAAVLGTVSVPSASGGHAYAKVVGDLTFGVAGQQLAGTFSVETLAGGGLRLRFGSAAAPLVGTANPLSVDLGNGAVTASVTSGQLDLTATGVAAALTVSSLAFAATGFTFSAGGVLEINTANAERTVDGVMLPARSVRVFLGTDAVPATLTIGGQTLSGLFAFSQVVGEVAPGAPPGTPAPRTAIIAATGVTLIIGGPGAGVSVTDGSGLFVVTSAGIAGRLQGTVAVTVPGNAATFSGTFAVAVNSTGTRVTSQVTLGTRTETLDLPAGPYLRVDGTQVVVMIGSQRLAGDLTFVRSGTGLSVATQITLANVSAAFGDGTTSFVTLTAGTGTFTLNSTGLAGNLSGIVTLAVPGLTFGGTLGLAVDTSASIVHLTGSGITLTVGGVSITGSITVQQTGAGAARVVTVGITGGSVSFGSPLSSIALSGNLVLSGAGLTGRLSLAIPSLTLGDATATGTFVLEVNTASQPVTLAGVPVPAGPFVRITASGVVLSFGSGGPQAHRLGQRPAHRQLARPAPGRGGGDRRQPQPGRLHHPRLRRTGRARADPGRTGRLYAGHGRAGPAAARVGHPDRHLRRQRQPHRVTRHRDRDRRRDRRRPRPGRRPLPQGRRQRRDAHGRRAVVHRRHRVRAGRGSDPAQPGERRALPRRRNPRAHRRLRLLRVHSAPARPARCTGRSPRRWASTSPRSCCPARSPCRSTRPAPTRLSAA